MLSLDNHSTFSQVVPHLTAQMRVLLDRGMRSWMRANKCRNSDTDAILLKKRKVCHCQNNISENAELLTCIKNRAVGVFALGAYFIMVIAAFKCPLTTPNIPRWTSYISSKLPVFHCKKRHLQVHSTQEAWLCQGFPPYWLVHSERWVGATLARLLYEIPAISLHFRLPYSQDAD